MAPASDVGESRGRAIGGLGFIPDPLQPETTANFEVFGDLSAHEQPAE